MTEIIDHGKWVPYTPVPWPEDKPRHILFCKRESDNVDWYEFIYRLEDKEEPASHDERGIPIYPTGRIQKVIVREDLTRPYVKCAAYFQPAFGAYIIGPAVYDVTRIFPANAYAFEITDYTGSDPQADFGGKAYDPITHVISDPKLVQYGLPRSIVVERINAAGKFNALKTYLNTHALESELWYGTPIVEPTNAMVLALLKAIKADHKVILAPP